MMYVLADTPTSGMSRIGAYEALDSVFEVEPFDYDDALQVIESAMSCRPGESHNIFMDLKDNDFIIPYTA